MPAAAPGLRQQPIRIDVRCDATLRPCPVCAHRPPATSRDDMVICQTCGVRFRPRLPRRDEATAWAGYLADNTEQTFDRLRRPFYHALWRSLRRLPDRPARDVRRILDVGCVPGFLLEQAERDGWTTYGVELEAHLAAFTAHCTNATMFVGRVEDIEVDPTCRFHLITFCDVARHVVELPEALRRCHDLLEPGGAIAIREIDAAHPRRAQRAANPHPLDLQIFTDDTLEAALRAAGFVRVRSVNSPMSMLTRPAMYRLAERHPDAYRVALQGINHAIRCVPRGRSRRMLPRTPSFISIGYRDVREGDG